MTAAVLIIARDTEEIDMHEYESGTVRCHGCGERVDDWDRGADGEVYCLRCMDPDTSPGGYDDRRDARIDGND